MKILLILITVFGDMVKQIRFVFQPTKPQMVCVNGEY